MNHKKGRKKSLKKGKKKSLIAKHLLNDKTRNHKKGLNISGYVCVYVCMYIGMCVSVLAKP